MRVFNIVILQFSGFRYNVFLWQVIFRELIKGSVQSLWANWFQLVWGYRVQGQDSESKWKSYKQHPMKQNLATILNDLITTRLDFSITHSVGQHLKTGTFYWFSILAAGVGYRDHISPVLKECPWLPIHLWTQFKVLVPTFKSQNSQRPAKDHLLPREPEWQLHSQIVFLGPDPVLSLAEERKVAIFAIVMTGASCLYLFTWGWTCYVNPCHGAS